MLHVHKFNCNVVEGDWKDVDAADYLACTVVVIRRGLVIVEIYVVNLSFSTCPSQATVNSFPPLGDYNKATCLQLQNCHKGVFVGFYAQHPNIVVVFLW